MFGGNVLNAAMNGKLPLLIEVKGKVVLFVDDRNVINHEASIILKKMVLLLMLSLNS